MNPKALEIIKAVSIALISAIASILIQEIKTDEEDTWPN
jgi:hypothetical protein